MILLFGFYELFNINLKFMFELFSLNYLILFVFLLQYLFNKK